MKKGSDRKRDALPTMDAEAAAVVAAFLADDNLDGKAQAARKGSIRRQTRAGRRPKTTRGIPTTRSAEPDWRDRDDDRWAGRDRADERLREERREWRRERRHQR